MSLSEVWDCGWNRLKEKKREGKIVTVIHLGDHDPSGVDMTRDITERISLFAGGPINIHRIALNIDQVEHYEIPPDPAKSTDSRFKGYVEQFGEDSWELDALTPNVIADLIEKEIVERVDMTVWEKDRSKEQEGRDTMAEISERFSGIQEWITKSNMEGWQFE